MSDYEVPEYENRRDWMLHEPLKPIIVKYTDVTVKERLHLRDVQMRLLKEGKITKGVCQEKLGLSRKVCKFLC